MVHTVFVGVFAMHSSVPSFESPVTMNHCLLPSNRKLR